MQADPIGTKDDLNLYAYVGNDSVNQVDPKGFCSSIKNETKRADCLEKRATAVAAARAHLAGQSVESGEKEAAYIAIYDEETGEVSERTGDTAGKRTGDDVQFTDNEGNRLRAQKGGDGRLIDTDEEGNKTLSKEIVLATGHAHTIDKGSDGRHISDVDNANEDISRNPRDKALSTIAPAVIKTPSEKIKVFHNEKDVTDEY